MIDDLMVFLWHAVKLETEAADSYDKLVTAMEARDNQEVADLFRKFAGFSRMHLNEILDRLRQELGDPLPDGPERFSWPDWDSPENPLASLKTWHMTPRQAMELALATEIRACDFYAEVAGQTRSEEVQELAQDFAEEEAEHADHLRRWLKRLPDTGE
jgi:rubrerythrin